MNSKLHHIDFYNLPTTDMTALPIGVMVNDNGSLAILKIRSIKHQQTPNWLYIKSSYGKIVINCKIHMCRRDTYSVVMMEGMY